MSTTRGWLAYQACGWPQPGQAMQEIADTVIAWAAAQPLEGRAYMRDFDRDLRAWVTALPPASVAAAVLSSGLLDARINGLKMEKNAYDTLEQFLTNALYVIVFPVAIYALYETHGVLDERKMAAAARRTEAALESGNRVTLPTTCASYRR